MSEHKHRFGFWYWLPGGAEQQRNCISCPHTEKRDVTLAEEPEPIAPDADHTERLIAALELLSRKVEANSVCLSRRIEGMEPIETVETNPRCRYCGAMGLHNCPNDDSRIPGKPDTPHVCEWVRVKGDDAKVYCKCGRWTYPAVEPEAPPAEPWPAWIETRPPAYDHEIRANFYCTRCNIGEWTCYKASDVVNYLRTHADCKARE